MIWQPRKIIEKSVSLRMVPQYKYTDNKFNYKNRSNIDAFTEFVLSVLLKCEYCTKIIFGKQNVG